MSNWGIEDDTNLAGNNDNLPGPKALRDAYEAQKKKTEDLENALASVQSQLRNQSVTSTLSELGIPATAAQQYKGEADPEKVREWATTMQTIFGGGSGTPNTPNPVDNQPSSGLTPEAQAQYDRLNGAGQQGTPLGNFEAAQASVNDATDLNGLLTAFQNLK